MILSLSEASASCRRFCFFTLFCTLLLLVSARSVHAQSGGGVDMTGTGGSHTIQGRIYSFSGQRSDARFKVKLESLGAGELSVFSDSNGTFSFRGLGPGSYAVVIEGGNEYETAREPVFIEPDPPRPRDVVALPVARLYTVQINLQPKRGVANTAKAGVINAALASVPAPARELYQNALVSAQSGNNKRAIEQLRAALAIYPNFPLALNELGVQYLKINQADKASEAFSLALKLSPDDFTPRLNYGIALLESTHYADAESQLRRALAKNDNAWAAHMYLGITLMRQHKFEESEKEFQRTLTLGGDKLSLPHYYLGGIYWNKGDYKRAVSELETYLKLSPNVPDAEHIRATIKELRSKNSNRTPTLRD